MRDKRSSVQQRRGCGKRISRLRECANDWPQGCMRASERTRRSSGKQRERCRGGAQEEGRPLMRCCMLLCCCSSAFFAFAQSEARDASLQSVRQRSNCTQTEMDAIVLSSLRLISCCLRPCSRLQCRFFHFLATGTMRQIHSTLHPKHTSSTTSSPPRTPSCSHLERARFPGRKPGGDRKRAVASERRRCWELTQLSLLEPSATDPSPLLPACCSSPCIRDGADIQARRRCEITVRRSDLKFALSLCRSLIENEIEMK